MLRQCWSSAAAVAVAEESCDLVEKSCDCTEVSLLWEEEKLVVVIEDGVHAMAVSSEVNNCCSK